MSAKTLIVTLMLTMAFASLADAQCSSAGNGQVQCQVGQGGSAFAATLPQGGFIDVVVTASSADFNEQGENEFLVISAISGATELGSYSIPDFSGNVPLHFVVPAGLGSPVVIQATWQPAYDGDESADLLIGVNAKTTYSFQDKQEAAATARLYKQYAEDFSSKSGADCLDLNVIKAAICAAFFTSAAATDWMMYFYENSIVADPPDSNYGQIVQPVSAVAPTVKVQPGVTQQEAEAFNALLNNNAQCVGLARAIYISLNRAQTASAAGQTYWVTVQQQAADEYSAQLGNLLAAQPQLWAGVQNAWLGVGLPKFLVTQADALSLASQSLDPNLVTIFTQNGLTSNDVNVIQHAQMQPDLSGLPITLPDVFTDPNRDAQLLQAAQVFINIVMPVDISVKPGATLPPINPFSKGGTPVAVLSSPAFNAVTQVDRTSLTFGTTGSERSLVSCSPGGDDVNGDGLPDLVCTFSTVASLFQTNSKTAILQGKTNNGEPFKGSEQIQVVGNN